MDERAFALLIEPHRRALHLHCYRMLGSLHDADDALQETMLRAWKGSDRYEPHAQLTTWLHAIATNVCLTAIARRRARPAEVSEDLEYLQPYPDRLLDDLVLRETVELAFITAIQLLPPKQRAVLILRDVLGWSAKEAAEVLEDSVAAVTSALQRARAGLERARRHVPAAGEQERALVKRFMAAWDAVDIDGLVALLSEDASMTMPPERMRVAGARAIGDFFDSVPHDGRLNEIRLLPTSANRQPTLAAYSRADDGRYRPNSLVTSAARYSSLQCCSWLDCSRWPRSSSTSAPGIAPSGACRAMRMPPRSRARRRSRTTPRRRPRFAAEYASKNGLTLAPGAVTISNRVQPNDTISVAASTSAPGFFSRLLGFTNVTVKAKAAAETGQLGQPRYVTPIVVSKDHPLLSGPGCPWFNQQTDLPLDKMGAPGAFGLLNLDGSHGGNGGPGTLADWILNGYSDYLDLGDYYSNTGAKFDASEIDDALTQRIHTVLLFPVFDTLKLQGTNAQYHVIGWVGFYLESFTVHGHTGDLVGHFTTVIWQGLEAPNYNTNRPSDPAKEPDYGARNGPAHPVTDS